MTVLILLVVLLWLLVLVLIVLGRILRIPGRAARISVRPLPWPRIDIRLEAETSSGAEPEKCTEHAHFPDRQVSTG